MTRSQTMTAAVWGRRSVDAEGGWLNPVGYPLTSSPDYDGDLVGSRGIQCRAAQTVDGSDLIQLN